MEETVIQEPEIQKTMRELLEWTDKELAKPYEIPPWARDGYVQLKEILETFLEALSVPMIVKDYPEEVPDEEE